MRQQSPPWRQQRSPRSALEGGSIADALSRLHQAASPESKPAVQRTAPFENRNGFRDANSGGNGVEASSNRGSPRPFGRVTDPAQRDSQRSRQSESEAVRVAVRVRPMSERETAAGLQKVVSVDDGNALSVVDPTAFTAALALERNGQEKVESSMWAKRFSFDRCFGEEDSDSGQGQEKVFDEIGAAVVDQAFSGYNATVFAYGQTGSGKSYTMMGSGAALDDSVDPEDHGLIPRICSGIFERVDQMEQEAAFRGQYRGSVSRIRQGREMGGVGDSALPRNDGGPEHCAGGDGSFNPTTSSSSSSSRGKHAAVGGAAVEDSTPYADPIFAEGAPATATHTEFSVEVSYLEIYNESLRDLFNPATPAAAGSHGGNSGEWNAGVPDSGGGGGGCVSTGNNSLRLREDPTSGIYVEGLTSIAVSSWDEMSQLLTYGGSERTVAATNANDWSSRSHAVFTLTLRQTSEALSPTGTSYEPWEACSSVNLVDLAGSERVSHTGATGLRLQEAGSINRSLAALSDVIKALSEAQRRRPVGNGGARSPRMHRSPGRGGRGAAATAPRGFVPYRNSVLTRLLKESLGGNSRTVMLACVSPCDAHYEETLGTLRYAERAKRVRTRAVANSRRGLSREGAGSDQAALVERLSAQVYELKQQLAEVTTAKTTTPMSPPVTPVQPGGGLGTPGGDTGRSSPGGFAPVQAAGGQGYIYVVDPALQVEIERLRETVADRERVIEDMEIGERRNLHAGTLSTAQPADGRDKRRPKQGGGGLAVADSGSSSTRSDVSGRCSSSPSSPASASASASASACSGQLSILTPPRAEGPRGLNGVIAIQDCNHSGQANETSGETEGEESGVRLLNLNQDPMFSECMSFLIREDGVTVVGSAEDADIRLAGDDVLPRHAVINFGPDGDAVLTPLSGASVHINGIPILVGAEATARRGEDGERQVSSQGIGHGHVQDHRGGVLRQDCRVLFGSRHFFRVECSRGLPSSPGACRNVGNNVGDGGPSAVETKPVKIDWDFAQKELRDATARNNNDGPSNIKADNTTGDKVEGGGLVEHGRVLDVDENASAKPDAPEQQKEDVAQQPQPAEEANGVNCEGEHEGDVPPSDGGPLAAAPEIAGSSETMGVDAPPSPGVLPAEISPARSARSEEISQTVPASPPGAVVEEPALSTETISKHEECLKPQPQDDASAPSPSSGVVLPILAEPGSNYDPPLTTATAVRMEEDTSSVRKEVGDTPPAADCDASSAAPAGASVAQTAEPQQTIQDVHKPSEKCGAEEPQTEAEPANADHDERGKLDRSSSHADGRHSQDTRVVPPPSPLPPPLPPPSPKAGGKNETELTASSKAVHVNKATLMELQRAREAWREAEGELERSQEERDELRATLQAVQEQARERRRSDRKEKRDLDKEKTMAANRARALEADRDRLRQMLSKSDEEVADLRGQLQKAQAAAVDAAAAAAAASTAFASGRSPGEGEPQSDNTAGLGPVSAKPSPATTAAAGVRAVLHRQSSRGRRTSNSSAGDVDQARKSDGGGGWQVRRPSALPVVPDQPQDIKISGAENEEQALGGDEENRSSDPNPSTELRRSFDSAPETAVAVSETRTQLPTSIPTDHSGLQQQRQNPAEQPAVQRPLQQEPREQEQEQQQTLQPEERTSGSTSFRCPSNRPTQIPDAATLVVESGNATPNNDGDNSTTRSIHASGDSGPTPAVQNPAIDTHTNTTTTTTTIVITSGEKSRCYSPAEDQPLSVEEQRGYNRGGIRGRRGSRGGRKLAWKDNAGELAGEGSEEEEMAGAGAETGAGAATRPADEERHPTVECGDDDMFLRESRAEIEAARRLLDRHSVTTTTTATAAREGDAGRTNVPAPAVAMEEENSTVVVHVPPAVGAIHDPGGEASIEKRVTMSPALGALSRFGDVAETEGASSSGSNGRITRPHPSDSSAKIPASGGAGAAEDFYRAALSTHLSFIATTAADDPPSSLGSTDGRAIEEGGRKPAGGVGEACRALQGDVAGVRQRLEAIQSKFSREGVDERRDPEN